MSAPASARSASAPRGFGEYPPAAASTARAPQPPKARDNRAGTTKALLLFFAFWVVASFGFVALFIERLGV
jgi:hypothetical protein